MRVVSRAPGPDRVVLGNVPLTKIPQSQVTQKVSMFFGARIAPGYVCYSLQPTPPGAATNVSLQVVDTDQKRPPGLWIEFCADWQDGVIAVATKHPDEVAKANILAHDYDYFIYPNVELFPRGSR